MAVPEVQKRPCYLKTTPWRGCRLFLTRVSQFSPQPLSHCCCYCCRCRCCCRRCHSFQGGQNVSDTKTCLTLAACVPGCARLSLSTMPLRRSCAVACHIAQRRAATQEAALLGVQSAAFSFIHLLDDTNSVCFCLSGITMIPEHACISFTFYLLDTFVCIACINK